MKKETKQKTIRLIFSCLVLIVVALAIYLPIKLSGALDMIDSVDEIKQVILSGGAYSYILFFVLQFLQVTVLPIPSIITVVAGTLIFGPWITFIISFVAVILGSVFAFFFGKKLGSKLINWIVGKEDSVRWAKKLEKGKYVFFLMMLFPFFPDDILCLVAGTTTMSYKFFLTTNIITRPISIGVTCFLGSGTIIPFSGWGIVIWAVVAVVIIVAFYVSLKYQKNIENIINNLGEKISNKIKKDKKEI